MHGCYEIRFRRISGQPTWEMEREQLEPEDAVISESRGYVDVN